MIKNKRYSLYLALGLIIIAIVTTIMAFNSTYTYINTKNKTIEDMKNSSRTTILSLKDNVKNLIAAYAVSEYESLIHNEISRKDIFAIIVKDYNMGKILGNNLISGKIKDINSEIINYDPTDNKHISQLENCFYSDSYDIISEKGKKLGTISIYLSDDLMKKELNDIIIETLKNSIILSLLLIISLFITIRIFILKPIYDMTQTISQQDKDGIPIKHISNNPLIEINDLTDSINKMINSIKKSTNILKSEQSKFQYLLELSPIAVRIAKDKGENVIFANNAYSKLLHMDKKETINKNPKDCYTTKGDYENIIKTLEKNESINNKLVKLNIKDQIVWALASYMNINYDGEDAIIGWFYDVSNEKNNEKKLYEALELQTTIFDNSGYLIIRTDKDGLIKQINKETEKLLGYKAEELVDKHTPKKIHLKEEIKQRAIEFSKELKREIKADFEVFVSKSNEGFNNEHEWIYVTKEGKHIPVSLAVTPLRNKNNEIYGYLGIARDITQNKLIESQAKLASMGEMIGNIAHQWRQPLSVISTVASGTKVKSEFNMLNEKELLDDMDSITLQAQYLSKTIDDFRDFIKNKNDKEKIFISKLIDKTLSILSPAMSNNNIQIIKSINEDMPIYGFENELIQALINILNNSKDAIKDNSEKSTCKYIFIKTYKQNNTFVLSIKDNGGGIKKDIMNKIFDPYFTTKHKSIGTGIGLSMAYQILKEHHDTTIKVSNETFTHEEKIHTGAHFEIVFNT